MAKRNQMLNICRQARGWDLIVRTPKFTYSPKKKISVTGSRMLLADNRNPASYKACTTRAVIDENRTRSDPMITKSSR